MPMRERDGSGGTKARAVAAALPRQRLPGDRHSCLAETVITPAAEAALRSMNTGGSALLLLPLFAQKPKTAATDLRSCTCLSRSLFLSARPFRSDQL